MPTQTADRRPIAADLFDSLMDIARADQETTRRTDVYPQAVAALLDAARGLDDTVPDITDPSRRIDAVLGRIRAQDGFPPRPTALQTKDGLNGEIILPWSVMTAIGLIATTLDGVADRRERITLAQKVIQATRYRLDQAPDDAEDPERYELIRTRRDIAAARLLQPLTEVQETYHPQEKRAKADHEAGRISDEELSKRLKTIRREMASALRRAEERHGIRRAYKPTAVAGLIGVSRGLVTSRIRSRAPQTLPEIPLLEAEADACQYGMLVHRYTVLQRVAEQIRNEAIASVLTGDNEEGLVMSNSEVQRITDLTSARVSQLRHGRR